MKTHKLLGIDPGLRFTGFAVAEVGANSPIIGRIEAFGLITTDKGRTNALISHDKFRRAGELAARLRFAIDEFGIDALACELPTRPWHKTMNMDFGILTGVIASLDLPTLKVSPLQVKQAASGRKSAEKREIIAWALPQAAKHRVPWPTSPIPNKMGLMIDGRYVTSYSEHLADALAALQAGIRTKEWRTA